MADQDERRNATRFQHRAHATLNSHSAHILNVSETGALVAVITDHQIKENDLASLVIDVEEERVEIKGKIAHVKEHYVGVDCSADDCIALAELIDAMRDGGAL